MLTPRTARGAAAGAGAGAGPSQSSPYPSRGQNPNYQQTPTRGSTSTSGYRNSTNGYQGGSGSGSGSGSRGYNHHYQNGQGYTQQQHQQQHQHATYHHPPYPPGPLAYFQPPPGQPTLDPTFQTPPRSQAMLTTYSSRLRTGVTGLIQPENVTGGPRERELFLAEMDRELFSTSGTRDRDGSAVSTPRDSPAPFGGRIRSAAAAAAASGRRGRKVNYAEKESDEEGDEDGASDSTLSELDEPPSDPDDVSYGDRRKKTDRDRDREREKERDRGRMDPQTALKHGRLRKKKEEMDKGWTWLGDRVPGDKVKSRVMRPTRHHYLPEEVLAKEAQKPERLVPITIDFDVPSPNPDLAGIKIKDRFLWNANEKHITPYQFATIFCEDAGIPINPYARTMSDLMEGQIEEVQQVVEIELEDKEVTPDEIAWDDSEGDVVNGDAPMSGDPEVDTAKTWAEADCRVVVNLDVQIYAHILRDRIEWDLSSTLPPTVFAQHYCTELGLTGEAIPLVAHAITEELIKHKKDCLDLELFAATHPDEQAKWERSGPQLPRVTHRRGGPGLIGIWRDWSEREEFGPVMMELSTEEMERREQERLRESRRLMRGLTGNKRRR